jgi:hypothetical protein
MRSLSKPVQKWDGPFCYWEGATVNTLFDTFLKGGPDRRGGKVKDFNYVPSYII